jgi:uncharacterized protein
MEGIWDFIQKQLLGMKWLDDLTAGFLSLLGLDLDTGAGGSIRFYIFDVIKIFILLSLLIFLISYIQSYYPPERTKKILGRFKGIKANFLGALLGTVTPFCSCSSIPLFIGFTSAGLPVGVTFSFLISSPLVDLAAFILLISVFGIKTALAYVIVGILLAVAGGTIIDKAGMERYVEPFIRSGKNVDIAGAGMTRKERLRYAADGVRDIIKRVWLYILIGVGVGALIHNWIPADVIKSVIGSDNPFAVILVTLIGIPIYSDIFGTIPIAEALFAKGVGIGTILSFMMAVTALSLPSIIMLKKVVKTKLLAVFVGIVAVGIIIIGYLFNFVQSILV